mmetsp:Transcript_6293/g.9831  ORF Transcript_6293/g.9831 Transcript_6293/m.9831 type:complete len:232 (+) Transcript_6293:168-863(+)
MFSNIRRSLCLAAAVLCLFQPPVTAFHNPSDIHLTTKEKLRQEWLDRSMSYYSKVMREERQRNLQQIDPDIINSEKYQEEYKRLAAKHFYAIKKVKDGRYKQAEVIYKRIINEIMADEEDGECDHAKLAVTTLLLALHCQRMGDLKKTRSVFLSFYRVVVVNSYTENESHPQCACCAKVLGAFALFEMKQNNSKKALEIARKAVEFDPAMKPVLNWKQFRDVKARKSNVHT